MNKIEQALNIRYGRDWDIYRNGNGLWSLKIKTHYLLHAETIEQALQQAIDWTEPAEEIPSMPELLNMELFEAVKGGGHWQLNYNGKYCGIRERTKKAALAASVAIWNRRCRERSDWIEKYGSGTV